MNTLNATDDGQAAMPAKPGRRWLKTVALAGGGTVLLAVLAVSGLWWWAGTDGSLATALRWAEQSLPLSAGRTTGSLRAGGHIERLVWQQDGLTVQADDVSLAWQPGALLQGMLKFERLAVASLQVDD
jgi:translocation and assembly module TamB